MTTRPAPIEMPGPVSPDMLYRRDQALAAMGWGAAAFDQARKDGLQTMYKHGRCYVLGRSLIEYLEATAKRSFR